MTDVSISQVESITDAKLLALADSIADGLIAAGTKAAAFHASPKNLALPRGASLESSFLAYLRNRPLEVQQRVSAKALPLVVGKQVKGLEGVDLSAGKPVFDLAMSRVKFSGLSKPGSVTKRVPPTLEEGVAGFRKQASPDQLQFHLLSVKCIDETNGFLGSEAGSDEIAFGGVMVDAGGTTLPIPQVRVGDFGSDGAVRNFDPPRQFGAMDLRAGSGWPKTFTLSLTLVELDNGAFPELLQKLYDEARKKITEMVNAATENLGETIGEVIGAALNWVLDKLIGWIKSWWEDDVFSPITVSFNFASADAKLNGKSESDPLWMEWSGHGGRYRLWYKAKLALAAEATAAVGAVVYQHANYGGKAVTLPVGHYSLAQLNARGMGNDAISSLKVGAGMRVIAYQHDGFGGAARLYTRDVSYVGNDFNDQISSIVVEPMRVMLFQHANYGGASQSFGPGRYDVNQLKVGNDQASSVLVPPGYRVTVFQHAGFKGTKKVFTGDASYVGNDFNDQVSSLIVELL